MDKAASRIRLQAVALKRLYFTAKGVLLHSICGIFALQMRHYWNAKGVHLKGQRGALAWQKG